MSVSMRPRGAPLARFPAPPAISSPFAKATPRSGSDGGYPWHDGELLYAADLNAAITATSASVLDLGAKGDGVSDDTEALQTALNTFAGKATVVVPDTGLPYLCGPLTVPTGTDLLIFGTIKALPGSATTLLTVNNANNVTIRGHGTLDGNGVNQTSAPLAALDINQSTNVQVSGVTLQDAQAWNLNCTQSSGILVDGVRMLGGNNSPEFANGCTDCWLTNSYVDGPAQDGGFAFYGGCVNCGATGNVFTNANQYGCSVVSDPGQPTPCTGIIISNNVVFANGFIGIAVLASGVAGAHTDITISDNQLYNNNTHNSAFGGGAIQACDIWLASCYYVMVSNNKMQRCGSGSNGGHGIVLSGSGYGSASAVTITGNDISDEGQGTTTGVGIYVTTNTSDIFISGNHIYDDQGTKTMVNAIGGACGLRTAIIGNFFGPTLGVSNAVTPWSDTTLANCGADGTQWRFGNGISTQANVAIDTAAGATGALEYQTASAPRWFVGLDGAAQTGSNAGSNYQVASVGDDNNILAQTLVINRATGVMELFKAPTFYNLPTNAANDAAAATAGVPVGGTYRNGSILQVRVS